MEGVHTFGPSNYFGSPAERAGLKPGDIVLKFGRRKIRNYRSLERALRRSKPGQEVPMIIRRGAETLTLTATVGRKKK